MTDRAATSRFPWLLVVGACALGLVAWNELTSAARAQGVTPRALGPANETYLFTSPVSGSAGPAAQCVVCHALGAREPQRVAPGLAGIVGAPKARAGWFAYSPALRAKGGTWTEDELDRFLANPRAYAPGTTKIIPGIADDQARRELIAYLKTLPN